nr:MAG TPA: hypothetical protein [Caudoviricetes sp.]
MDSSSTWEPQAFTYYQVVQHSSLFAHCLNYNNNLLIKMKQT